MQRSARYPFSMSGLAKSRRRDVATCLFAFEARCSVRKESGVVVTETECVHPCMHGPTRPRRGREVQAAGGSGGQARFRRSGPDALL
jgi:hypothetical protein